MRNSEKAAANEKLCQYGNNAQRQSWKKKQQIGYDYYLGDQLSKDEISDLKSAGMPTFIINRMMPVIEMMKFFVTANNPRWQAVGVEESDADVAQVHSIIAEYIWNLSNGKTLFPSVVFDALTRSVGYFHIKVDPYLDNGLGEVVIERWDSWDVVIDPKSTDPLYRDASFIQLHKNISREQLARELPDYKRKIMKATASGAFQYSTSQRDIDDSDSTQSEDIFESYTPDGEMDDILDYYYTYSKEVEKVWNVTVKVLPDGEELETIKRGIQEKINDMMRDAEITIMETEAQFAKLVEAGEVLPERADFELERKKKELSSQVDVAANRLTEETISQSTRIEMKIISDAEFKIFQKSAEIMNKIESAIPFWNNRIKIRCSVGDQFLYEKFLDRKIKDYPVIPIQYIYTGTPYPLSACTPLVGKQEEINKAHQIMIHNANLSGSLRWLVQEGAVDDDVWDKYSSTPSARLTYRQGFDKPDPIMPLPINNAFFTITQEGKEDFEYISGMYASSQGDVSKQHDTYRGLLAQDEYGTRRIRAWMQSIVEPALEHLGRVVAQFAQATYTLPKTFRIVQPNNLEKAKKVQINMYPDYSDAINKFLDYQSANFDVYIVAGSTAPVNRWALIDEYFRWYQAGLIDDVAMLAETDIRNKDVILERKSLYMKQKEYIQKLEEALKNKEGTIETLERQIVQSRIRLQAGEADLKMRGAALETEAQLKAYRRKLQEEEKTLVNEESNK